MGYRRTFSNLNEIGIEGNSVAYTRQTWVEAESGGVSAYFDHLGDRLVEHISAADLVCGCVAWLTNRQILEAMAEKHVALVVQKEDFLRPDMRGDKTELRRLYAALRCRVDHYSLPGYLVPFLCESMNQFADPIRCVGNYNRERHPAFPRMHHKFAVFCRLVEYGMEQMVWDDAPRMSFAYEPYAVWTGSFNFTEAATASFENAVVIRDENIVRGYANEFAHIYAMSESLNWSHDWIEPEYYIGT